MWRNENCSFYRDNASSILRTLGATDRKWSYNDMPETAPIDRKTMIELLNEDLSREYQAIIAYVNYSQVIKGAVH